MKSSIDAIYYPIRREIWEHHGAFVTTPKVILCAIIVLLLMGSFLGSSTHWGQEFHMAWQWSHETTIDDEASNARQFEFTDKVIGEVPEVEESSSSHQELDQVMLFAAMVPYLFFWAQVFMVMISYWLSCLVADRKDNSILFWKSLPVSETHTVLTKLTTTVFILPLIAWISAFVMSIIIVVFAVVMSALSGVEGLAMSVLTEQKILLAAWQYLPTYLAQMFWMLPVVCWAMLASAIAKKTPFLWAVLPILGAVLVEGYLFRSYHIGEFMFNRATGQLPSGEWILLLPGWEVLWHVLTEVQTWVGLLGAAGMLVAAIWLRENRYEI